MNPNNKKPIQPPPPPPPSRSKNKLSLKYNPLSRKKTQKPTPPMQNPIKTPKDLPINNNIAPRKYNPLTVKRRINKKKIFDNKSNNQLNNVSLGVRIVIF